MLASYYERLGVAPNATPIEIKAAYRRLARIKHPDKGGTTEEFQWLQKAYETLLDPDKRAAYDKFGRDANYATNLEKAQQELVALFTSMSDKASDGHSFPTTLNLVNEVRRFIITSILNLKRSIEGLLAKSNKLKKISKRLTCTGGNSILHNALREQRKNCLRTVKHVREDHKHLVMMSSLVDEYSYSADIQVPRVAKEMEWVTTA
jgi:curved DNA-binding protein CbpA